MDKVKIYAILCNKNKYQGSYVTNNPKDPSYEELKNFFDFEEFDFQKAVLYAATDSKESANVLVQKIHFAFDTGVLFDDETKKAYKKIVSGWIIDELKEIRRAKRDARRKISKASN